MEVRFVDHGIVDNIHYRYLRDLPAGSSLRDLPYQVNPNIEFVQKLMNARIFCDTFKHCYVRHENTW